MTQLIGSYISNIDPKAEIILYGSRARGDEKEDSHWDILILADYPADLTTERKFYDKIYDLKFIQKNPFLSLFIQNRLANKTKNNTL
jgi:uncharacterized protein